MKRSTRSLTAAVPILAAALLGACDDPAAPEPTGPVSAGILRLVEGDTVTLRGDGVAWTSDAPSIAAVDRAGRVTALAPGWARVIGTRGGGADTAFIGVSPRFTAVEAGDHIACGLASRGELYCWGSNVTHQIDPGDTQSFDFPVRVAPSRQFVTVSASSDGSLSDGHLCGIDTEGALLCWGNNSFGEAGAQQAGVECRSWLRTPCQLQPTVVMQGTRFRAVATGDGFTCAITTANALYCWGLGRYRQTGRVVTRSCFGVPCDPEPAQVLPGTEFRAVVAGAQHACAITTDGATWCWGAAHYAQTGDASGATTSLPRRAGGTLRFNTLAAGYGHTCGLTAGEGSAYCWGADDKGQLGRGEVDDGDCYMSDDCSTLPVPVLGDRRYATIEAVRDRTCAVEASGTVYCWGSQPRPGDHFTAVGATPVAVGEATAVAVGTHFSCALGEDGGIRCWGDEALGIGVPGRRAVPVLVSPPGPPPAEMGAPQ